VICGCGFGSNGLSAVEFCSFATHVIFD
jgi:hypothetical protein